MAKKLLMEEARRIYPGVVNLERLQRLYLEGGSLWIPEDHVRGTMFMSGDVWVRLPRVLTPEEYVIWGATAGKVLWGAWAIDAEGLGSLEHVVQVPLMALPKKRGRPRTKPRINPSLLRELNAIGGALFQENPKGKWNKDMFLFLPAQLFPDYLLYWGAQAGDLLIGSQGLDLDHIVERSGVLEIPFLFARRATSNNQ